MAVVSFTPEEVIRAFEHRYYRRFEDAGVKTGTLFAEFNSSGVLTFTQFEGDVR